MIVIVSQGDWYTNTFYHNLTHACLNVYFMLILSQIFRGHKMWIWQKSGHTRRVTTLTIMWVHFRNSYLYSVLIGLGN